MVFFKNLFLISLVSAVLVGCGGDDNDDPTPTPSPTSSPDAQTVVDVAVADGRFTTLVTALQATDLDAVLDDESGTFTVFAPTDDAFALLGDETITALLADTETLSNILLYHVVSGAEIDAAGAIAAAGTSVEAANGDDLAVSVVDGSVFINDSEVIIADVQADNGIIHVIDAVLMPPEPVETIVDVAVADGRFTTLVAALQATDLDAVLDDESGTFTVFAPTDDAFALLGDETITALLADTETLSNILLYHVVSGAEIDAAGAIAAAGTSVAAANGDDLAVSVVDGNVYINESQVIIADVQADNGIIHAIDAVLMPPAESGLELSTNGDFSAGLTDYNAAGGNIVAIAPVAEAGNPWDVNLSHALELSAATEYELSFSAKASVARDIIAGIGLNYDPFTNVSETVSLTTEWVDYTLTLNWEGGDDSNSRVIFDLGAAAGDVYLSNVQLETTAAPDVEILTNGDFDDGTTDWVIVPENLNLAFGAQVEVAGNPWDVNLSQPMALVTGNMYRLTFDAKASVERTIIAGLGLNEDPFTNDNETVTLTTEWATYSYEWTLTAGIENSRSLFDLGADVGTVYLDNIVVEDITP